LLKLTAADFANLSLLESRELQRLLADAALLPFAGVPADLVTMYSRVLCVDAVTGERQIVTLVFPGEEDLAAGKLSVLGAGMGLLGASPGHYIECEGSNGVTRRLRVERVIYQPEHDLRANLVSA
jgi:regulator of nucleoside diphosphate kinase